MQLLLQWSLSKIKYASCKQWLFLNIHIRIYEVISSKWSTYIFLLRKNIKNINSFVSIRHIWICSILITLSGDIEKNPGRRPSSGGKFSICHWNLYSILAHNFIKISLLRAYIPTHNFNILRLQETYVDSSWFNFYGDVPRNFAGIPFSAGDFRAEAQKDIIVIFEE